MWPSTFARYRSIAINAYRAKCSLIGGFPVRTLCIPLNRSREYQRDSENLRQAWISAHALADAFDRAMAKVACAQLERAHVTKWGKYAQ
jgi:hypothetical protein